MQTKQKPLKLSATPWQKSFSYGNAILQNIPKNVNISKFISTI